jgi:hypothetical protein
VEQLALIKVERRFADAGAEAPLLHLPFVPQGVAAKLSVATILHKEMQLVPKN